jgi:pimeloyl-ACP methyl ester carboxylesterase
MPILRTDDGVDLHYEEAGSGTPMVFVHEFAGDSRSWEMQMRFFSRRYRWRGVQCARLSAICRAEFRWLLQPGPRDG